MTHRPASTGSPAQLFAAGPVAVGALLEGEPRSAELLGAFPTAVYLRLATGRVIAVLTRDAVRLPLGLVLAVDSTRHPLDGWSGRVMVGGGEVRTSAWRVRMSRVISVAAPTGIRPGPELVGQTITWLRPRAEGLPEAERLVTASSHGDAAETWDAVRRLLGGGPGLTPAGDDVLAGFLVGAWSFGLEVDDVRTAVLESAPTRTTALSAELLACAARGESVPQVTTLLRATQSRDATPPLGEALVALARVGHSSGVALAVGVVAAARVFAATR
jgi:hypothetical protein